MAYQATNTNKGLGPSGKPQSDGDDNFERRRRSGGAMAIPPESPTYFDDRRYQEDGHYQEGLERIGRRTTQPYGGSQSFGGNQSFGGGGSYYPDESTSANRNWWHREPLVANEIMTNDVKTVSPSTPVKDIAELMRREDVGIVPVVDERQKLVGLVTDRDLVVRGLAGAGPIESLVAADLSSNHVEAAQVDTPVTELLDRMGRKQVRRIPIVDRDERLLGVVSLGDIARRADEHHELQEAFEKISNRRSFWNRIWR